ncbi:MAG: GDSL-type esterase/lipase family protein [Coleofasciculus sp. S288]|nr:GDSL-type esterase/lipase family protein [Coleofasciculus sp. S288]
MSNLRICFVGDSFVNGTGDPECLGWTGRVCAAAHTSGYPLTYYNLGIRRETSADIAQRWREEVSLRLPEDCDRRVVFSFGANDTTWENGQTRVSLSDSIENTSQILKAAKQRFPVLMIGSPPIADFEQNRRIAHLSGEFASVCREIDLPYLDVFTPLQNSDVWMNEVAAFDGAHPQVSGYAELSRLVQNWSAWQSWFG